MDAGVSLGTVIPCQRINGLLGSQGIHQACLRLLQLWWLLEWAKSRFLVSFLLFSLHFSLRIFFVFMNGCFLAAKLPTYLLQILIPWSYIVYVHGHVWMQLSFLYLHETSLLRKKACRKIIFFQIQSRGYDFESKDQ